MRPLTLSLLTSLLLLGLPAAATAQSAPPKRVLVFGDSNTWGWIPRAEGTPTTRYPADKQWPRVAQASLGPGYELVVDALSGRTTDVPDPSFPQLTGAGLDGSAALPSTLAAQLPLDLVVILLGTNDLKAQFGRSAFRIALGAGRLVDIVQKSGRMFGGGWYEYPAPKVLLVVPPPLGPQGVFAESFRGGEATSRQLAKTYQAIAAAAGAECFDASAVITTDGVDGVHFTEETQRKLGTALAEKIRALLP